MAIGPCNFSDTLSKFGLGTWGVGLRLVFVRKKMLKKHHTHISIGLIKNFHRDKGGQEIRYFNYLLTHAII